PKPLEPSGPIRSDLPSPLPRGPSLSTGPQPIQAMHASRQMFLVAMFRFLLGGSFCRGGAEPVWRSRTHGQQRDDPGVLRARRLNEGIAELLNLAQNRLRIGH